MSPSSNPGAAGRPPPSGAVAGFLRSFVFAGQGAWYVLRTQRNMRVHLGAAAAAVVAGALLSISAAEWACIALAIGLVMVTETINTVVEALIDLYTQQFHPLAKIAKDTAAGAVLIASIAAVGVAAAIFLPRLF